MHPKIAQRIRELDGELWLKAEEARHQFDAAKTVQPGSELFFEYSQNAETNSGRHQEYVEWMKNQKV